MAGLQKIAGSRIYIGSRVDYLDTVTAGSFAGQAWTRISKWVESGSLGAEQALVTQALIDGNNTLYAKGSISFPVMANTFVPDLTDAGQIAFAVAQRSCKPYAFKVEWSGDCAETSVVTITVAEPGVVTWNGHGLAAGTPVTLSTTGALPTGLVAATTYYVVSPTDNAFSLALTPGGDPINTSSTQSGVHTAVAQPVGETALIYGFAMYGTTTGGGPDASRLISFPIQPIAGAVRV
jgi:hypothetical protein